MVLLAGNTVWSISECIKGVHEDSLYKSTLPLLESEDIQACLLVVSDTPVQAEHLPFPAVRSYDSRRPGQW